MTLLNLVIFPFLAILAMVACVRSGKVVIHFINGLFDKIEGKINGSTKN